jgi:hypothetical protein
MFGRRAFRDGEAGGKIMLVYALIVFGVAAVGGLVLASSVLRGKFAPWAISLLHAGLGAAGLVLLFLAVTGGAGGGAPIALGILLLAALLGFFLASLHARKQLPPRGAVLLHAAVAVTGFGLLAATALNAI